MDEGSRVGWPDRKFDSELSALQHAFNLRIRHPLTFDSEYQNEPKRHDSDLLAIVPPASILIQKLSRVPRNVVPLVCDRLTAFIDMQQDVLFYMVCGWSNNFTGSIVDYGTEPDQRRYYFGLRDLNQTLRQKSPGSNIDGGILEGLRAIVGRLLKTNYQREDGVALRVSRVLIDAGYKNHLVYQTCRDAEFSGVAIPSYGRAIGPQQKPINAYEQRPGDQIGLNWMVTRAVKRASRHVLFDANWWKSFVFDRFTVSPGDIGSLTIHGSDPQAHHLLGEYLTVEYPTQLESKASGRTVTTWEAFPGRDNHWLDTLVGNCVAASMTGVILPSIDLAHKPARTRRRITANDIPTRRRA
ncbi:MAG: terminase gpA endonuclease subunit [Pirellulaceae bacterium]